MSNKIGRFEILSEIAHSDTISVYKATDPESGQTVALKTVKLEALGEQAPALVKNLLEESAASKVLNSHNIAVLYAAEEVDGIFCASLEYVQGNSVATMLARKEGFSIWDLQDIARQTCQGLDHAHAKNLVHYTLEPAKIMVSWDGTVKILGFGISTMSAFAAQASGSAPGVLHYMSPEQLRGDPLGGPSNIFSLGAIFYEMVTERKAFDGEDADQVRQSISEMTPVAPDQINRKIHPALSQVIMKALSKAPEERYQSGQDLVNDLERCKESATKTAAAAKPGQPAQKAPVAQKPASAPPTMKPPSPVATSQPKPVFKPAAPVAKVSSPAMAPPTPRGQQVTQPPATRAAAAGRGTGSDSATSAGGLNAPNLDQAAPIINNSEGSVETFSVESFSGPSANMSSAAIVEPEVEAPKINVDPMMAEGPKAGASTGRSFSEIDELPPLKEVRIAPPPRPTVEEIPEADAVHATVFKSAPPEKPKVQPREVAKKAVAEIKKTPPQLFVVSIAGAVLIILVIVAGIAWHIHSENADDDATPAQTPAPTASAPTQPSASPATETPATNQTTAQVAPEAVTVAPPAVSVQPKYNNKKKAKAKPTAPAIVPGQLSVASTPAGAQIQIDGQNDPTWVTPFNLAGLNPGQHSLTISKPGYASENRTIDVGSGSKSFVSVQLAQLTATVSVTSDPAGAAIWMDGKDTGRVTPAQISVDKAGNHSFAFKKQGYLDETTTANLQMGQTFRLAQSLKALGNTDDIKMGGKFKKLFGSGDTAGMGAVSIKTSPKGAQVAINNRILDKNSPVELYLDPGNYVLDITLSGFKSIHKVITVEKSGKVVIDESLDRE
ncbi:MAG TPA: PEGA domain-containing protein [Terriglobales bacterium]|nr:PEGA domain-containing protein [Terriglobales bacterium]